ncbi:MAG: hypothetical protein ACI9MR_003540 [Myxococcota bacterium]|jgi:hypothetical protein
MRHKRRRRRRSLRRPEHLSQHRCYGAAAKGRATLQRAGPWDFCSSGETRGIFLSIVASTRLSLTKRSFETDTRASDRS